MQQWGAWLLVVGVVVGIVFGVGWLFAVDAGAEDPGPVDFDDTVQVGLTDEARLAIDEEVSLPRAQVAYSGYRYVVGYWGLERAAIDLSDPRIEHQLGHPLAVYVTDYSVAEVTLDDDGHPRTLNPVRWRAATEVHYVVDSEATGPAGPIVMPFADEAAAADFIESYGGELVGWDGLLDRIGDAPLPRPDLAAVEDRRSSADDTVAAVSDNLERPVSVTVGEDTDTIQGAVDAAPNDTAVLVPQGTYEEQVTIDRPVTLVGDGAVIDGGGNGTVITVTAADAAVVGVTITGVGAQHQDPDAAEDDPDEWDHNIELGYGHGDAGIAVIGATDVLVANASIDTPANGVLLRDAPGAVVDGITVDGSEDWLEGFMGVMAMRSPGVLQDSTITGGRDGIYLHRSHGMVVRDNRFDEGRYGIHLMHTSGALFADNTVRDQELGGIMLMTDPNGNMIVGNDVRRSAHGITTVGSANLVADNLVADNAYGLRMADHDTRYEGNVLVDNDVGARVAGFLPTNTVVSNDFVGNTQQLELGFGPLEVWSERGSGNYWGFDRSAGMSTSIDRPFAPADPVDSRIDRVDGALTLANSPGIAGVAALRDSIPGLRQGVIDTHPLDRPANPDRLAQARSANGTTEAVRP